MKLITLGSGGWIPTESRHTASYLVDTGESLIILDTGSGLSRLSNHLDILNKYEEINIIYSHYHLDHLIGLSYIGNWSKQKRLNIYGPGKELGFSGCQDVISKFITHPFFPLTIDKFAIEVRMMDYDLKGFKIGTIPIKITPQIHSGKSFGISLGDYIHYSTDTTILENTFKEAQGTKLLLHECWTIVNEGSKDHSSFEEINEMISKYKIQKLGLIHINPNWNVDKFEELSSYFADNPNIIVVEDEMVFEV
jgi:ribonuclease BN (tRNA processing enzyme)